MPHWPAAPPACFPQDQLIEEQQRAINDTMFLLSRLGEDASQPADWQIVLPGRKLVVELEGGGREAPGVCGSAWVTRTC